MANDGAGTLAVFIPVPPTRSECDADSSRSNSGVFFCESMVIQLRACYGKEGNLHVRFVTPICFFKFTNHQPTV